MLSFLFITKNLVSQKQTVRGKQSFPLQRMYKSPLVIRMLWLGILYQPLGFNEKLVTVPLPWEFILLYSIGKGGVWRVNKSTRKEINFKIKPKK